MYKKRNYKKSTRPFIMLEKMILNSPAYIHLSPYAKVLLIDLFIQYNGKNNGDFSAAFSDLSKRGWKSNDTLPKKIKELLDSGLIIKTRQGWKNKPCLYAVTWLGIDECNGKLDISSNPQPYHLWKKNP